MLLAPAIRIYLAHQDTQACRHPARCICPPLPVQARNVMLKSGGLGGNVIAKVECIDILFDILLAVNPYPLDAQLAVNVPPRLLRNEAL